jgi:Phage tail protein
MAAAAAGLPWTLFLDFTNEATGLLADPDSVTLDITYGQEIGFVADYAGPFYYSGAASPVPGQVWRIATGRYAFIWQVPPGAATGVYVANWTCVFGSNTYLGVENFPVSGGYVPLVPSGDVGYWTGSIDYTPATGNLAQLTPVSIPLGAVDANGIAWLINKLEGWDGPDVQGGGVIPKSGDHGAWATPQYYAARNLTLTVTAMAPTQALRDLARSLLQQAIPVSDLATFTINEPIPKQALVRRSGKVPETYTDLGAVTFTIGLVAPDPRKYSAQQLIAQANAAPSTGIGFVSPFTSPFTPPAQPPSGSVIITNTGSFETRPLVTVTGPVTSPSLTNVTTGQTVSWSGLVLGPSDVLAADFSLAQGLLNGVYRPADLFSSWWTLPPGVPCTVLLGGTAGAGASISVAWRAAFI